MYISRELDNIKPNYCFQNPNMKNNKAIQGKHDGDSSMVIVVVVVAAPGSCEGEEGGVSP